MILYPRSIQNRHRCGVVTEDFYALALHAVGPQLKSYHYGSQLQVVDVSTLQPPLHWELKGEIFVKAHTTCAL